MSAPHYPLLQDLFDQLIQSHHDSEACFRTAAQAVSDLSLRSELIHNAQMHAVLANDLQNLATRLNLRAFERQMNALTAMPGRSTFRHALVNQDRYAILAQCQTRLCQTIGCYDDLVTLTGASAMPAWIKEELTLQHAKVEASYAHIHQMCLLALPQFPRPTPTRPAMSMKSSASLYKMQASGAEPLAAV